MRLTRIKDRGQRISRNPASKPIYQRRMLEALARGLSPRRAAEAAGLGRSTAFLWRQQDPEFAAKWNEAVAEGIDLLEDEARRRAVDGYNERPIFRDGVQVGEIRTYSDRLLIFLLKRRRPEVFARPRDANPPNGFGPHAPRKSWAEVLAQFERLGLPAPKIEGDYEENDPREHTPEKDC